MDIIRRALWTGLAVAALAFCASAPAAAEAAAIHWHVRNPFRFFTDPSDTQVHRATFLALSAEEKATPILSAERALSRRHQDGWAATMYKKTCWDGVKNRFTCPQYPDYTNPAGHAVVAEIAGVEDASNLSCTWKTAPRQGGPRRGDAVRQPCNERVAFEVPYPSGLDLTVEIGGVVVAHAGVKVRDVLIVAMGDSFGSGEGNPDVPVRFSRERSADYGPGGEDGGLAGYPARVGAWKAIGDPAFIRENARWLDQACHRSLYSQQMRAALQLAIEDPHRSVTFAGLACSGAEVTAGLFLRYKGNEWVPNPPILSQVSAAAEVQCGANDTRALDLPEAYHINGQIPQLKGGLVLRKCQQEQARRIDLVFLSIGGNDVGFSRLVANTVLSDESILRELGGWLGEVFGQAEAEGQLKELGPRYKSLNRALHSLLYMPWDESDRIVLTAYPGLALTGDGSETCKDGNAGLEVVSDFQLSEQKLREGIWIADKLHRAMRDAASTYGWTFVETHRRQFIDRGICSGAALSDNPADELLMPRKIDGVWKPYNPADFQAYASRQRWFRTPNDAFMTGNFHVAQSLFTKVLKMRSLSWFQLLLASTYSGAFHPTAEGNAAIADAVAAKARVVLQKYGQGPEAEPDVASEPAPAPAVSVEIGVAAPSASSSVQTQPSEAVAPAGVRAPADTDEALPPIPKEGAASEPERDPATATAISPGPANVETAPMPEIATSPMTSSSPPSTGSASDAPAGDMAQPQPFKPASEPADESSGATGTIDGPAVR